MAKIQEKETPFSFGFDLLQTRTKHQTANSSQIFIPSFIANETLLNLVKRLPLANEIRRKKTGKIWNLGKVETRKIYLKGKLRFRTKVVSFDFAERFRFRRRRINIIDQSREENARRTNKTTHNNKRKRKASFFFLFLG